MGGGVWGRGGEYWYKVGGVVKGWGGMMGCWWMWVDRQGWWLLVDVDR